MQQLAVEPNVFPAVVFLHDLAWYIPLGRWRHNIYLQGQELAQG